MNASNSPDEPALPVLRRLPEMIRDPSGFFAPGRDIDGWLDTLLAAWLLGVGRAVESLATEIARRTPYLPQVPDPLGDHWVNAWMFVSLGSIGLAVVVWFVGAWWYRVRLAWAGAVDPEPDEARIVFVLSGTVVGVALLLHLLLDTALYPSYWAAAAMAKWYDWPLLAAPLLGYWVSYRGALSRFRLDRAKALLWFLILPVLFYLVLLVRSARGG